MSTAPDVANDASVSISTAKISLQSSCAPSTERNDSSSTMTLSIGSDCLRNIFIVLIVMSIAACKRPSESAAHAGNHNAEDQGDNQSRSIRDGSETVVASPPVMFTHQSQPQSQLQTQANQIVWPNHQQNRAPITNQATGWPVQSKEIDLIRVPINQPPAVAAAISQDEARQLERYMINYPRYLDTVEQLNLANINSRPMVAPSAMPIPSSAGANLARMLPTNENRRQLFQTPRQPNLQRSDTVPAELQTKGAGSELATNRHETAMTRRDRAEDVILFNKNSKYLGPSGPGVLKKLVHDHIGHSPLPPGCIGRASSYTSKCEDHLIKRLSQDATEGRTVLDVSRRVCCALFWHKDCISRVVVELCPDSNPAAADLLLGSRSLDLTMSCQRFNRDGCNGTPPGLSPLSWIQVLLVAGMALVVSNFHLADLRVGQTLMRFQLFAVLAP